MADQLLDAKGLNCPLPILRAKKALKDVAMGGTLEVLATDPGAVKNFEAFCRATGNELLASKADGKIFSLSSSACLRATARGGFDGVEPLVHRDLLRRAQEGADGRNDGFGRRRLRAPGARLR